MFSTPARTASAALARASPSAATAVRASASASTFLAASGSLVARRNASGGGGYNQPTGYLFGEKPPPKGQKRQKEDWENIWMYGMFGGMALAGLLLTYRPDTTIQTWAMGEAKKRLEESGEVWQYKPSPYSGYPDGIKDK